MRFRATETDPVTGIVTEWYVDEHSDKVVTRRYNPATDNIIDRNKALHADSQHKRWGDGRVAASVPLEIFDKDLHEAFVNDDHAYIKRWLNDPDHRHFRTFRGNV